MSNLIPYTPRTISGATVQSVDGRDLHAFLDIGKDYSNWVKQQIKRAHLLQGTDYEVFAQKGVNPSGGRPTAEYAFTFEAAKHVAMVSGAPKGHEVRAYFIACEKALTAKPATSWDALAQLVETGRQQEQRLQLLEAQQRDHDHATMQALTEANTALRAANQAMHGQAWLTIHQYVTIQDLERQMPLRAQQDYGRYLTGYCSERGYRVYAVPVAHEAWKDEKAYWIEAIAATLPGWLMRYTGQPELTILPGGA